MAAKDNIDYFKDCPLCTNLQKLEAYLLPCDEVILFDWFTIMSIKNHFCFFYHPLERIMQKTHLKRCRIEGIIKRFEGMGILYCYTYPKAESVGRVKYYVMDFAEVVAQLPKIIDKSNKYAPCFNEYFTRLCKAQKEECVARREGRVGPSNADRKVKKLFESLNETFADRIKMYNKGELTNKKPQRAKSITRLTNNKGIRDKLKMLLTVYDDSTIAWSFTALCDSFLRGEKATRNVDNIIKYFLTYDASADRFGVFETYLAIFQKSYSHENNE